MKMIGIPVDDGIFVLASSRDFVQNLVKTPAQIFLNPANPRNAVFLLEK